jgi:hypothetical protein
VKKGYAQDAAIVRVIPGQDPGASSCCGRRGVWVWVLGYERANRTLLLGLSRCKLVFLEAVFTSRDG